jgi:hypothetical protein
MAVVVSSVAQSQKTHLLPHHPTISSIDVDHSFFGHVLGDDQDGFSQ